MTAIDHAFTFGAGAGPVLTGGAIVGVGGTGVAVGGIGVSVGTTVGLGVGLGVEDGATNTLASSDSEPEEARAFEPTGRE